MEKDTELVTAIKARTLEYLGHIMRNERRYDLLQDILQEKIPGKRGPSRRLEYRNIGDTKLVSPSTLLKHHNIG
ncbi:hypothetical protein Trydic_g16425 [Trypoxylus dichotomus]